VVRGADSGAGRTLTASQLDFINLIVTYLTDNGVMDAGQLYESPSPGSPRSARRRCSRPPTSTRWSRYLIASASASSDVA